jgi:hypothetical protein
MLLASLLVLSTGVFALSFAKIKNASKKGTTDLGFGSGQWATALHNIRWNVRRRVVQPAAVEAAVLAGEEEARKQDDVLDAWRRDLEAARYASQRAQKQYDAADPQNRLVADELECRWNQALQRVQEIEQRIEQHVHGQGKTATPTREEFQDLAAKLEAVWNCPEADIRLKKRIIRTLIHEVVVDVDPSAGEVNLVIHWKGGVHTELRLPRRRRGQNSAQTSKEIIAAVRVLARMCSDDVIAGALNRNGLLTGRGNRWTQTGKAEGLPPRKKSEDIGFALTRPSIPNLCVGRQTKERYRQ